MTDAGLAVYGWNRIQEPSTEWVDPMSVTHLRRFCICIALLVVTGCGQGSDIESGDAPAAPTDETNRVPTTFGTRAVAATDDWMLGVTSQPYSSDEPSSLLAVDLRTGDSKSVPGPVFNESPVTIEALIAEGTKLVGIGNICRGSSGDEGCHGPQKLVRFDPANASWTLEDVPFDQASFLDAILPVGRDFLVVESKDGTVTAARHDSDGRWSEVAKVDMAHRPIACATSDDLWLFSRDSGDSGDTSANDASYALKRIDLASGQIEGIVLPEFARYFGGVTTSFGCGQHEPFVASTPPGSVPPADADPDDMEAALTGVTVRRFVDGAWETSEVEALDGRTVPDSIVSGPVPLFLGAEMKTAGENSPIAVLLTDDGGRQIPRMGTDAYLWRGTTGDLIRVFDQGSSRQFETVSVTS